MYLCLLPILFVLLLYWYFWKPYFYWKNRGVICVTPLPFFGNVFSFCFGFLNVGEAAENNYQSLPKKKVCGVFFFDYPVLLLRDPEIIKRVAIKDFNHFAEHNLAFITEESEPLWGKSIFSLPSHKWRQMRATISPVFTGSKMRAIFGLVLKSGENLVDHYRREISKTNNRILEIDLKNIFTKFTNDVIASTAYGLECNSFENPDNIFYRLGKQAGYFKLWKMCLLSVVPFIGKITGMKIFPESVYTYFDAAIKETIKLRQQNNINRSDLLQMLLEAKTGKLKFENSYDSFDGYSIIQESNIGKYNKQMTLTDSDISAQAFIFFAAGFKAVSNAMSFITYEIATNSAIKKRLQNEIDSVRSSKEELTYEKINKMKYLDMVVSEGLRKWPPIFQTDRFCTKPYNMEVDGKVIPLEYGSKILIPIWAIHRDPKFYPDPEKFDPERFNDANKVNIVPNTYLPFGIGPRGCLGSRFALMELKIGIFYTFANFDFEIVERSQVPLKLKKFTLSVTAENGFWIGMKLRNTSAI